MGAAVLFEALQCLTAEDYDVLKHGWGDCISGFEDVAFGEIVTEGRNVLYPHHPLLAISGIK